MGCGASSGAGPFSALDHGDIPSVVVHKRPADSGLPALVRDPFTADAVLAKLDGADKALRLERRAYEDERILQVLPDRRAERQERQKDYAYALGSLLAIQTLREAAAREKVPEILKPREPTDIRGAGVLATVKQALKMKMEHHLATIAGTQAAAKQHTALRRRITALANARLYLGTLRFASSNKKVAEHQIAAQAEQWRAMRDFERVRDLAVAKYKAKRRAGVAEGALAFMRKYEGKEEVGALMMDAELRQKYGVEHNRAREAYAAASEAAKGVKDARDQLATCRERLRVVELLGKMKPTDAQMNAAEAAVDEEICIAARALEGTEVPRNVYKNSLRKLDKCIGALSVLDHARAVRASLWKPDGTFQPRVQRLTLDVNVSQFPSSAVTATITYVSARAVLKRELMEALSSVCALLGCKHAYRVAKRRMLFSQGAQQYVEFLQKQTLIEVRSVIKQVEGGIKADMDDAEKVLGQDSIDEHEQLKLARERWYVSKGTMEFLDGIVLGGLGGFAPDVRSAAQTKADQRKLASAKAVDQLGMRRPAKEKARQIEGKLLVMASVKDLAQKLWDCQVELRNLIKQDQPPLSDQTDPGIPKEPEPEPEPETGTVGAPEPEPEPEHKPSRMPSMFQKKPKVPQMSQYERKELEEQLNKKVEQAWDNWCDALAHLRSSFDFARRAAGYEMEAIEIHRVQLRESYEWLHTVRGRIAALELVSRPRGGVTAFLKHKKIELQIAASLAMSTECAAEEDHRAHRSAILRMTSIKEASVFLSYMIQVRLDTTLKNGPERARWRPEAQRRMIEEELRNARQELPTLSKTVLARTAAKRRYQVAKGAVEWLADPSNSLRALKLVNPAVEEERSVEAQEELKDAEEALGPAQEAAAGVKDIKQWIWTTRQKLAVLEYFRPLEAVPDDREDGAEEEDEGLRFARMAVDAELYLRGEKWACEQELKRTAEAAGWYKDAKVKAQRTKGALALVEKLVAAVNVPDEIEDEVDDVLRLTIQVLGEGGAGKGPRELVVPVRATAEMVMVKLVEDNWPDLDAEAKVRLQVLYNGLALPAQDALVEHEIVSGEKLHLLLPPGCVLPADRVTEKERVKSRTGFTDGSADGLLTSVRTLKERLASLSFAMAEDQWAVMRDQWTVREGEWLTGASERMTKLKEMFVESGVGEMKEDPDLEERQRLLPFGSGHGKRLTGIGLNVDHNDWSWAPGVADAARKAQQKRQARLDATEEAEAERQKKQSKSKTGTGIEDWRFKQQEIDRVDKEIREMIEWSMDALESQAWQQEQLAVKVRNGAAGVGDATAAELVAAALRQQGRHDRWEAKARGEYEALWEGAAAGSGNARETCYSVQQADESATVSWGLLQKVNEAVAEEQHLEKMAIRQTILRTKQEPVPSPGGTMEATDHARAERLAAAVGVRPDTSSSYSKAVDEELNELAIIEDERPDSADRKLIQERRPRSPVRTVRTPTHMRLELAIPSKQCITSPPRTVALSHVTRSAFL
jgi:hypothetical protein